MDYSNYGIEDFLNDDSFLEYCLGSNDRSVIFWTQWLSEHPEKAELIKRARLLYYTLNGNIDAEKFNQDYQVFKKAVVEAERNNSYPAAPVPEIVSFKKSPTKYAVWVFTSIAASLLVVCGIWFFKAKTIVTPAPAFSEISFETPLGQKRNIKLPDGSTVFLNGGSSLKLVKGFNLKTREVTLVGEGYFNIAHNPAKPFFVHTAKISVKDIGTEFNIKAYTTDKTTEASLIKGLVEITINGGAFNYQGKNSVFLTPNKKFVINNEVLKSSAQQKEIKKEFAVSNITANPATKTIVETDWKENKLTFYDSSMDEMALQMERWYGVKIMITNPAVKSYHYTATFDHEDITQVLEALKLSGNFNYRKEGNMISIY